MTSIQRTLAWVLIAGFGTLLGAGGGLIYLLFREALIERFDAKLRVEALTIITYTVQERDGVDVDFTDRYIREFDDDVATQFFQVWHPKGRTIERSGSLKGKNLPKPETFGTLDKPVYWDLRLATGQRLRAIGLRFVPHADSNDRRRYDPNLNLELVVGALRGELDQTLASLRLGLLGAGSISVAGALILVRFALRKGLAPLRQVADQASAIDASTLGTRFPTDRLPVELVPICSRLNELLARLEASFEHERRFSADVAHELRTPIAELRSLSEVALKWPPRAVEATRNYEESLAIARRMESLVLALQTIARSETGGTLVFAEPIRLPGFLDRVWTGFASLADQRDLRVEWDMGEDLRVVADPILLEMVIANLFANAVEYTPAGGRVHVSCESGLRDEVTIAISNSTRDLTPADVPRLFERFWRKDASRTDSRHAGLGLALVRAVAQCLGARVSAGMPGPETLVLRLTGLRRPAEG